MDWEDSMGEDGESARIYNFKDKETCPMCILVEFGFDLGGNNLLKDRFAFDYNEHFHGAIGCYWQWLYYGEVYNSDEEPDLDELKKIAKSNFRLLSDLTGDTFFLKEADTIDDYMEVVELNNDIKLILDDYMESIKRINNSKLMLEDKS